MVGASNKPRTSDEQVKKINETMRLFKRCQSFQRLKKREVQDHDDGYLIDCGDDAEAPLSIAIEFSKALGKHNKRVAKENRIQIRSACTVAAVLDYTKSSGERGSWGESRTRATRLVQELCLEDQILVDGTLAVNLIHSAMEPPYDKILHRKGLFKVKHDEIVEVYSAYGPGFGNPGRPRGVQLRRRDIRNLFSLMFMPNYRPLRTL